MPSPNNRAAVKARFNEIQRAGKRLPLERLGGFLGTIPDADIAALADVSGETVRRLREAKKIPAFRAESTWTPARDKIVLDNDNATAAEKLGITLNAVKVRRSRLNKG